MLRFWKAIVIVLIVIKVIKIQPDQHYVYDVPKSQQNRSFKSNFYPNFQILKIGSFSLFCTRPLFNGFVTSCCVDLKFNPSINFRMSMPFRDGHRSSIRNSAQIVAEKVANWLFKDGGAKFMLKRWQNIRGIFCNIFKKMSYCLL